jgi:hypothetical protein
MIIIRTARTCARAESTSIRQSSLRSHENYYFQSYLIVIIVVVVIVIIILEQTTIALDN